VRLFSLIGLISYPLYATHEVLFRAVRSVLESRHAAPLLLRDDVLAGLFALALLLAYGLARFYDQPIRAWLSRRADSHTQR
jgi:peptidoglycan/LPS O-acetylase OafA/YrhL